MAIAFSRTAGWIFLILGVFGFFSESFLGLIQFDPVLAFVHLLIGILGLAAATNQKASAYALWSGLILIPFGIVGFVLPDLFGFHLEAVENLIHLVLGGWGLYAGVYKKS